MQESTVLDRAPFFAFGTLPLRTLFMVGAMASVIILVLISMGTGAVSVPLATVWAIFKYKMGLGSNEAFTAQELAICWTIRLPRVLLAAFAGAGLSISGAGMQALFRNPLAAPSLIGVSTGSALGAVTGILAGGVLGLGMLALPLFAFAGGWAATMVVYRLSLVGGQSRVSTLLLAGIAINALAGAGIGLALYFADDSQLRNITFWNLGSVAGANWQVAGIAALIVSLGTLGLSVLGRPLNALVMGEDTARHLGVPVEWVKRGVMLAVTLMVGGLTSFTGVIGFMGLVVPHIVRLSIGPDLRYLAPASALVGAALLLAGDLLARTLIAPAELPLGVITALIGAPFFLWLLIRQKNKIEI